LLSAQDLETPETADEFWNLREELLTQATLAPMQQGIAVPTSSRTIS
jgi:hypothetical protein